VLGSRGIKTLLVSKIIQFLFSQRPFFFSLRVMSKGVIAKKLQSAQLSTQNYGMSELVLSLNSHKISHSTSVIKADSLE
jgi:hypothetical protein